MKSYLIYIYTYVYLYIYSDLCVGVEWSESHVENCAFVYGHPCGNDVCIGIQSHVCVVISDRQTDTPTDTQTDTHKCNTTVHKLENRESFRVIELSSYTRDQSIEMCRYAIPYICRCHVLYTRDIEIICADL